MQEITFSISDELVKRALAVFGKEDVADIAAKAFKKALGDAELQQFSNRKREEIEAEARRLTSDLGL